MAKVVDSGRGGRETRPLAGSGKGNVTEIGVWGDFEVRFDEVLGRGGMGTVYDARQRSLNRRVAVKVLKDDPDLDPALRAAASEKFQIEIKSLALLTDPRIVTIIQAGENDGRLWFAMERIDGRTVEEVLSEDGALAPSEAARVAGEVARALDAAWKRDITHRDVKPGNVFILPDGTVKLADFGLARSEAFTRTRLTDENALVCTPAYASPEQAEGRDTDHRSDIYALGCVLYEMLTERPPFSGGSPMEILFRHSSEPPLSPRVLNPEVPEPLERVVMKCLEKSPEERYQSYVEVIRDLEDRTVATASAPPLGKSLPWAAAAGAVLFGVIMTAIYTNGEQLTEPPATILLPAAQPVAAAVPEPAVEPELIPEPEPEPAPKPEPEPEPYRPIDSDFRALRRLLEFSRRTLPDRMAWRFEPLPEVEESTPWLEPLVAAERERIDAAAAFAEREMKFEDGRAVELSLRDGRTLRGKAVGCEGDRLTLELPTGLRESIPIATILPESFAAAPLVRAGAGDAAGVIGELGGAHEVGLLDSAIEEAFVQAAVGRFGPLLALTIGEEARDRWAPVLEDRFRRLDVEAEAARLYRRIKEEPGAFGRLLTEMETSYAGTRAASETLEAFREACNALREETPEGHVDFSELVNSVAWGTWVAPSESKAVGSARLVAGGYALAAAGKDDRFWFHKKLRGARSGYSVRWSGGASTFAVAFSPARWIEIGNGALTVFRPGEERVEAVKTLELQRQPAECTVVPRAPLVLVYLDDRLVLALPEEEYALDVGLRLGVGGGSASLESIRVTDRTRD